MTFNVSPNTPLYYINLDKNKDRNNNIINLIKKYRFTNANRISAISTKTKDEVDKYKHLVDEKAYDELQINNNKKYRDNHYELSNGAIGCYLSHMSIYKNIIEKNIPFAIIMEDDCNINNTKDEFWKKISSIDIPNDTDIFLMDGIMHDSMKTNSNNFNKVNFFFCLHFYVITLQGAKKLLPLLLPIKMQIDSKLSRLAYDNKINIYAYNKKDLGIYQGRMGTDIQVNTCPKCNIFNEIKKYKTNHKDIEGFSNISNYNINEILIIITIILFLITIYHNISKKLN